MLKLSGLLDLAKSKAGINVVVAGAEEEEILIAVEQGRSMGLFNAIWFRMKRSFRFLSDKLGIDLSNYTIVSEPSLKKQSSVAVDIINQKRAQVLVKGWSPLLTT
jgi:phosphate butyryltransferase